ncbi:MAG: hypothetical protein HY291_12970 [Planctomycetes bacterium]|nr:hypothetical protein [Planctomycetota bacterium]
MADLNSKNMQKKQELLDFLENGVLYKRYSMSSLKIIKEKASGGYSTSEANVKFQSTPKLQLPCECSESSTTTWVPSSSLKYYNPDYIVMTYRCASCDQLRYYFLEIELEFQRRDLLEDTLYSVLIIKKNGQRPGLDLAIEKDRALRRVVEAKFEGLRLKALQENPGDIAKLDGIKKMLSFDEKMEILIKYIPSELKLGEGSLRKLYSQASDGIHNKTDEECVEVYDNLRPQLDYWLALFQAYYKRPK